MPVIKSAIKKLRQDKKREKQNASLKGSMQRAVRNAKSKKTGKSVSEAISIVDKAAKLNILHKNKASRIKSTLTKISKPVKVKVSTTPAVKSSKDKKSLRKTAAPKSAKK